MKVKAKVQDFFFDRQAVIDMVGKETAKVFSEFGSKVRKRAQGSLKYADKPGDKPAPAGQPPHAHRSRKYTRTSRKTGKKRTRTVSFLREFIYFKLDPNTKKTVAIGPEKLNSVVSDSAPKALEYGGTSTIVGRGGKRQKVTIAKHPFMHPAALAEAPGLPAMWRGSIR